MVTWAKCKQDAYVVATGQRVTILKYDPEANGEFQQVIARGAGNAQLVFFLRDLTPATHEASVLMASVKAKHTRVARLQEELDLIRRELKMPPITGEYLRGLCK